MGGDVIGRIYEYFLNKFAKTIASDDGVFFTPKSLVKMIVNVLAECGNNVTRAAKQMGLSRKGLQLKMTKYRLRRSEPDG